jgi:hypothetical protein
MEKVTLNKSRSQYLSLIVKKICQDRLNIKEVETYNHLKVSVDPLGTLEKELTHAWNLAEGLYDSDSIYSTLFKKEKKKFSLKNLFH